MSLLNFEGQLLLCHAFPETINTAAAGQDPDYRIQSTARSVICISNVGESLTLVPITSQPGEMCVTISLHGGVGILCLRGEQDALAGMLHFPGTHAFIPLILLLHDV